ncbi:hypothetical protein EWB00_005793 [Schistosoma japonicum]|uniref:Uncharacterized protein n=1 Tax=Schistosoma japonicum TaxID=6182 RepID=A0A4Z2D0J5_SCHJA|nr:hypothetical protein KSF78_0005041 [Schistosoma japonicum]TNN10031.1 hypothetical protein EWB00_005793 [Schistosoma japonicum]
MAQFTLVIFIASSVFLRFLTAEDDATKRIPFEINKQGDMVLLFDGMKYSLDSNLKLKIGDEDCWLTMDFARPTKAEIEAKSGTRVMTEGCNPDNQTKPTQL